MPLNKSPTRSAVSQNISELTHHGTKPRSHKQIVAIALSTARKAGAKFQQGGNVDDPSSWKGRSERYFHTYDRGPFSDPNLYQGEAQGQMTSEAASLPDAKSVTVTREARPLPQFRAGGKVKAGSPTCCNAVYKTGGRHA